MNNNGNGMKWVWVIVAGAAVVAGCGAPEDAGLDPNDEVVSQSELKNWHRHNHERCRRRADVPAEINAPAGAGIESSARGYGDQIYTCTAGAWVLKAPEADLLDERGNYLGNHFLGPVWQWRDGSKVRGARLAQVAAPNPSRDLPWLLLSATSTGHDGELERITHIQRINTMGGLAPAGACTAGAEIRVAYEADYLFYRPRACGK